jgi:Zn-dependent protease
LFIFGGAPDQLRAAQRDGRVLIALLACGQLYGGPVHSFAAYPGDHGMLLALVGYLAYINGTLALFN